MTLAKCLGASHSDVGFRSRGFVDGHTMYGGMDEQAVDHQAHSV